MSKPVIVIGYKDIKKYEGKQIINTTSKSKNWSKGLSPFFTGPVNLYDGYTAKNVENAWQFAKVYPEHVNEENNPNEKYFEWAQKGWNDTFAHRYPAGKGSVPCYSYWAGEKLDYIAARKKIYAPVYAQGVLQTEAFNKLLDMYEAGEEIILLDYDGYDYLSKEMTLKEVLNNDKDKMGHAFVLAMLLQLPEMRKKFGGTR